MEQNANYRINIQTYLFLSFMFFVKDQTHVNLNDFVVNFCSPKVGIIENCNLGADICIA